MIPQKYIQQNVPGVIYTRVNKINGRIYNLGTRLGMPIHSYFIDIKKITLLEI